MKQNFDLHTMLHVLFMILRFLDIVRVWFACMNWVLLMTRGHVFVVCLVICYEAVTSKQHIIIFIHME